MSNIAIKAENLSKAYQLGEFSTGTISRDIERWWALMRGKEDPFLRIGETNDRSSKGESDVVWSLKDIDFEINHGDAVGIIGRNGAGKSTLLKVLSRVTTPTTGSVKVKGRIASLLEVGTGFHPELTGRENIFLNGAILGMRKAEIKKHFDAIVDFAGVERYIDTPVKRYSSGMYVRLAFAVAAHLESEILIVDEVLAVGDAEFQKKCLGKMGEVSKEQGRTVLFVSHNMDAILRLCNKSFLLKDGIIIDKGWPEDVIKTYLNIAENFSVSVKYDLANAPGNSVVRLTKTEVINKSLENRGDFKASETIGIKVTYDVLADMNDFALGFNLYNHYDVHILSSHDYQNSANLLTRGKYTSIVWIPQNILAEGGYYCGVAAMSYKPFTIHFNDINKFAFQVFEDNDELRKKYTGPIPGIIRPKLEWQRL